MLLSSLHVIIFPCLEKYSQSEARIAVAYSTLPSRHYLRATASCGGDLLRTSQNHLQKFSTIANSSDHVLRFSDDFRKLPKAFDDFSKF